tara:strand:- start:38394 stop:39887 length:1494 start_codon:yes stop_codon:yes gene_type:complete
MRTVIQTSFAAINLYSEYFLGLLVSIIIARSLSTEDYGIYSSSIWVAGLITIAINSGLSITVTKFVAEFRQRCLDSLSGLIYLINRQLVKRILCVVSIFILLIAFNIEIMRVPTWLVLTLVTCAIFKAIYIYNISIFKGLQRFDVLAKTSMIANPLNLFSVAICAYFFPSVESFLLAYCLACIAFGLSVFIFKSDLPNACSSVNISEHTKRINTQILSATVIVFIGALVFRQGQILILENNNLLAEAGFFNIAFILATSAVTLIPGIYQEVLLPKIAKATKNHDFNRSLDQAQRYLLILCLMVLFPVIMYADVIIDILYGPRYQSAVFALQMMVIFKVMIVVNNGANLTLISKDRQVTMAKTHLLIFLLSLLLSFTITPQYGVNGALVVYGLLVLVLVLSYHFLAKKQGYSFISINLLVPILGASLISILPLFVINSYLSGITSALVGSFIYLILYLHLLLIFKGFDSSVGYLFKQLSGNGPKVCRDYFLWCSKQVN